MRKIFKQLLILILSILSGAHLFSQETSLLPDNMKWTEIDEYEGPKWLHYYVTQGDTIIDNIPRNKLYYYEAGENSEKILVAFFHLEGDKIIARLLFDSYIISCMEPEVDFVLYDFGITMGDSVPAYCDLPGAYAKLQSIDSIYLENSYKKVYNFDSYYYLEWIEGVGSLRELFAPIKSIRTGYPVRNLACCCVGDKILYLNPEFEKCPVITDDPLTVRLAKNITFCAEKLHEDNSLYIYSSIRGYTSSYLDYTWTGSIKDENGQIYPASYYLNDTTSATVKVIRSWRNNIWNQFTIEVKDKKSGFVAKDSINIRFSQYDAVPTEIIPIFINPGDSILFDASIIDIGGIRPYVSYEWTPRDWLSHPDSSITWCKPEVSREYICTVTDSSGCQNLMGSIAKTIVVNPASISSETATKNVYQSGETVFFENPEASEVIISFYDLSGKMIHSGQTKGNSYRPDGQFIPGVYLCKVKYGKMEKSLKYIAK